MLQTKKGETVVLLGFTGIRLSEVVASGATKTEIQVTKKDQTIMTFDRKTGIQKNLAEGKEKYANKIVSLEDAPAPKAKKAAAKPAKEVAPAKKKKVVAPDPVEEDEDYEDEEVDEIPAPKKKAAAKTTATKTKKKAAQPVDVEEDEDDEYEEV